MIKTAKTNRLVFNHQEGTIDRHYVNGRVDKAIGNDNGKGGLQIRYSGKSMLVHRLIFQDFHGPIAPWMQIDHILGKEKGNGIANLRWTDARGNSSNQRKAHRDNSSGLLGVSFNWNCSQRPWRAAITVRGNQKTLGFFSTKEDAFQAYLKAKRELHETCTI